MTTTQCANPVITTHCPHLFSLVSLVINHKPCGSCCLIESSFFSCLSTFNTRPHQMLPAHVCARVSARECGWLSWFKVTHKIPLIQIQIKIPSLILSRNDGNTRTLNDIKISRDLKKEADCCIQFIYSGTYSPVCK